jgi:hypothetical protein
MAKTLQFKRFSSTILANTVGASGELIIDSTKNLITVHDASTPGGWPVARESVINAINNAQSVNIQQSRDTANLALVQANLAFVQINADLNLQGGLNSANAKIALLQNQVYANTNVASYLTSRGINTYGDSNVTSYLNSANANISMLIGIQTTQNTNITTANNAAWAAFNKANSALANTSGTFGGDLNVVGTMNVNNVLTVTTSPPASSPSITTITTQNYNLVLGAISNTWTFVANGTLLFPDNTIQRTAFTGSAIDQVVRNTANTATNNITILQGVDITQNTNITTANNAAWAGYAQANITAGGLITANANIALLQGSMTSANANIALLQGSMTTANANIAMLIGIQTTQNTNINAAAQTVPQNAQSTNYTLQLTDSGKHIYYTQASNTILYIPTTSNVAFSNGSTIMIVSKTSSSANVTVSPNTGVSLYLAGNTTSALRNVTTYGIATLIQVAANTWFINGTGVV